MKESRYWMMGVALVIFAGSIIQSGCAMCCGPYDYMYGGHGGKWQRSDLNHGRVGSPFSDPNSQYVGTSLAPLEEYEVIENVEELPKSP